MCRGLGLEIHITGISFTDSILFDIDVVFAILFTKFCFFLCSLQPTFTTAVHVHLYGFLEGWFGCLVTLPGTGEHEPLRLLQQHVTNCYVELVQFPKLVVGFIVPEVASLSQV